MAGNSKGYTKNLAGNVDEILRVLEEEIPADLDFESDSSDVESSVEESDHDTDSEQSEIDEDEPSASDQQYFCGRNKNPFKWSASALQRPSVRVAAHNLVRNLPGVIGEARNSDKGEESDFWSFIFSQKMLDELLLRTNEKIATVQGRYSAKHQYFVTQTDLIELKACLGLLYLAGAFKSGHEDLSSLYATDGTGRDIFRSTMSLQRFLFLLGVMRFDNALDREERKMNDPLAAFSFMFNELVQNSQRSFTLGSYTCIDEMLVGFRGHCKFKMYIPSKPTKYGLKIMILADVQTGYFYNAYVYVGKNSDGIGLSEELKNMPKPSQAVMRLAAPILKSNRNITADNWFTSVSLAEDLKKKGLTYVGTIKKIKQEIPQEFQAKRSRVVNSTLYGFTKDLTLVSHVPKKNKCVLLLSSMHHLPETDPDTGKPEVIAFYNSSKGAVDSLDQKGANYSVSRRTIRWPMALFYATLDIAAVNSYILYYSVNTQKTEKRLHYLKNLGMQLVKPNIMRRIYNERLPLELRHVMSRILGVPLPRKEHPAPAEPGKRKRCYICPSGMNRKTNQYCNTCKKPICGECTVRICVNCDIE